MKHLITAAFLGLCPAALAADTFGLVIGIDDYDHVPDLQGAVNDANDIADALTDLGADVTLLLNDAASRAAVMAAWTNIATRAAPGDRIVVTYAGHGSYEPEHIIGSEADGRDENFLLAGFSFTGPGAGERIRDDEIAALIALSPQAEVVFVADSCHSGTVSRNIRPVLGYRYVIGGKLADDPLPPPPPRSDASEGRDQAALFLAAVDDSEKVPEFLIEGQPRGALSYSFAQGLRGAADSDQDGAFTKDEIARFVRRSIRDISQGVQAPRISQSGDLGRVILAMQEPRSPAPAIILTNPFEKALRGLPPVRVAHNGGAFGDEVLAGLDGINMVEDIRQADVFTDFDDNQIRSTVGDVLLPLNRAMPATSLQNAAQKYRVINAIVSASPRATLSVEFAQGDGNYQTGDQITVQIKGRTTDHLTLLAVAPNGDVGLLYPLQGDGLNDPDTVPPADPLNITLEVTPPYGADHIIAIETASAAPDLRATLGALNDANADTSVLWDVLRTAVLRLPEQPQIAVFPFHTQP